MKEELQQKLYDKYPKLFVQKDLPATQTAMCWGICCGDGWYKLLDELCLVITALDHEGKVQAAQVKEKFGGLRFYIDTATLPIFSAIHLAELASYVTCEVCGNISTSSLRNIDGWCSTLCDQHYKERKGKKVKK